MRKFIIATVVVFAFISCKAQSDLISSTEVTINSYSIFNASSQNLIENFGEPLSIELYDFEMENETGEIYNYNGLKVYILNNRVENFEITGIQYNFSEFSITTSMGILSLESYFPISFQNKSETEIIIALSDVDYYISIHYDTGMIQKIELNTL